MSAHHPYLLYVSQPQLLEFMVAAAEQIATFRLVRGARVDHLIQDQGAIRGVNYTQNGTNIEVRARLVVGADGRFSKIRQLARIEPQMHGAAVDMLWCRLPRQPEDTPAQAGIYAGSRGGAYGVAVYRREQWQIGLAFPKGTYQQLRASGLETVRQLLGEMIPWVSGRIGYLQDWAQTAVLSVVSSRVRRWHRPGLLLIGDAAHVMSPAGAVGINMAIADAVAAARILGPRLLQSDVRAADLRAVQRQREWHTRLVQWFQSTLEEQNWAAGRGARMSLAARVVAAVPRISDLRNRVFVCGGLWPERLCETAARPHLPTPLPLPQATQPTNLKGRRSDASCRLSPQPCGLTGGGTNYAEQSRN